MKKHLLIILTFVSGICIFPLAGKANETRCGWLHNPTPANWWLIDKDGRWIISAQGGYQAQGMGNIPNFDDQEYVKTNGYHGYGCACLDVVTNDRESKIVSIQGGQQLPLNTCRTDPALPAMR